MRIAVTGGGTGGHIFPAIAVCEALKLADSAIELLYIGGSSGMESGIVPPTGIPYIAVTARKMPASLSIATAKGVLALLKGYAEAKSALREFRPDAVVGTGGYVAAATVLAARSKGCATMILENNVVPGRTNLRLAGGARRICLSFEETASAFPPGKCVVTGLPLRSGIVASLELSQQEARLRFAGMDAERFTLLVIGGSQGARAINNLILDAAPALLAGGVQIIHQTGSGNYEEVAGAAQERGLTGAGYAASGFLDSRQMEAAYRSADLVLCRGGISTLSEAAANGLPMIVVPLPTAYADHQTANARAMERLGAALCLPELSLIAPVLCEVIGSLRADTERLQRMAHSSKSVGRPNAAQEVAGLSLEIARK